VARHRGAEATEPIGQGRHAYGLQKLRAREVIAQAAGAALERRRLVPDRVPSEAHEQPLEDIQVRGVEMSQDLSERRLV
jgi:hypothetical protein